jgi:glycerol-3-phosphate cytidylyltransferase
VRIYTGGTFDLFHWGHVELLRRIKDMAGRDGQVIVSLNTDEFVEEYKGKKPVMSYDEREAVLLGCRYVSEVIKNVGGGDSRESILDADVDFVVVGTDWCEKDYMKQMSFTREWLEEHNVGFGYIPYTAGISTTEIKKRLTDR